MPVNWFYFEVDEFTLPIRGRLTWIIKSHKYSPLDFYIVYTCKVYSRYLFSWEWTTWTSGDVKRKGQLQKLRYPERNVDDLKNHTSRTDPANVIFMFVVQLANNTLEKEKEQTNASACLSLSAATGTLTANLLFTTTPKTRIVEFSIILNNLIHNIWQI